MQNLINKLTLLLTESRNGRKLDIIRVVIVDIKEKDLLIMTGGANIKPSLSYKFITFL